MNAVQAKVEALQGNLTIQSTPGQGTTFTIRLPRTLGPIQVELVRVGEQVYALPASRVEFQLTLSSDELARWRAGNSSFLDHRLRVFDLQTLLPNGQPYPTPEQCSIIGLTRPVNVGLCVDALLGRALWSRTIDEQDSSVPLLDLDQLIPGDSLPPEPAE